MIVQCSRLCWVACGALLLGAPAVSAAQAVQGTVRSTTGPIAGAHVSLAPQGEASPVAAFTTRSDGSFRLQAPAAGAYLLEARAIGYRPVRQDLQLGDQQGGELLTLTLEAVVFELGELVAGVARRDCRRNQGDRELLGKLLGVVSSTDAIMRDNLQQSDHHFASEWTTLEFLPRDRRDTTVQRRVSERVITRWPIVAPAHEVLRTKGFARAMVGAEGDGWLFYGADLAVITSDWFLASHCFWVEADTKEQQSAVARLMFEPDDDDLVGLSGFLELDTEDWTLRRMQYYHDNLPSWIPRRSAGGQMSFAVSADGIWYPDTWSIRAPIPRAVRRLSRPIPGQAYDPRVSRPGIVGYVEEQGRVTAVSGRAVPGDAQ